MNELHMQMKYPLKIKDDLEPISKYNGDLTYERNDAEGIELL